MLLQEDLILLDCHLVSYLKCIIIIFLIITADYSYYHFIVINITLPDEKSNYVHRIGRVGRAERMGLAISLVSSVPEKVSIILMFGNNPFKKTSIIT